MTPQIIREWKSRIIAEYNSSVVTARMLQLLILQAAPDPILDTCMRVIRDELDHAKLSYDCFVAFGGPSKVLDMDMSVFVSIPKDDPKLIFDDLVLYFLLGESFAVPLFHGMYQNAKHPLAKNMLTRVLQDESVHRAFGWSVLDFLISKNPIGVREEITRILPEKMKLLKKIYVLNEFSIPLMKIEKECGLLDISEYRRIWLETYQNDIVPRFEKRQIYCPKLSQI